MLFGKPPLYNHLKVFGCLCYVHQIRREKDKFGERSRRCVFLGYPHGQKGWRVYDIEKGECFVSRDVVFHENVFPYIENKCLEKDHDESPNHMPFIDDVGIKMRGRKEHDATTEARGSLRTCEIEACETNNISENENVVGTTSQRNDTAEQFGRGHRHSKPSVLLKDFVTYSARCPADLIHV